MEYSIVKDGYLSSCSGTNRELRLPPEIRGISGIFSSAFEGCCELEKLILPSTVEWVETGGLAGAVNLRELTIEENETGLDQFACAGCAKLAHIEFPADNRHISNSAFCGTPWLKAQPYSAWIRNGELLCYDGDAKEYVIPPHVAAVGENAFFGNSALERVVIGPNVQKLGDAAFCMCEKLSEVCIEGKLSIAPDAFDNTPWLTNHNGFFINNKRLLRYIGSESALNISDGIIEICAHAFEENQNIVSVMIPNTVEAIGKNAFVHCSQLSDVILPGSLSEIAGGAFTGCIALKSIAFPPSLRSVGPFAFSNCKNLEHIDLPQHAVSFGKGAFYGCIKLKHNTSESGPIPPEALLLPPRRSP